MPQGTGPAQTTPPPATTIPSTDPIAANQNQSAKAIITGFLTEYGLGALADQAWQMYLDGQPIEQLMLNLRKTDEYKARFPGMEELSKKGRAYSEAEYIAVERGYVQLFREFGIPEGFYDSPEELGRMIGAERSVNEQRALLEDYRVFLYQTSPTARAEAFRLWGLSEGELLANIIDAKIASPLIHARILGARAAGSAVASGWGALTRNEAEQLGMLDMSGERLEQGFDFLGEAKELFNPIIGEQNSETISREDQLGAVFQGNTAARRRIEKRARERVANFQGGGGFATTQQGVTGLGSAAT